MSHSFKVVFIKNTNEVEPVPHQWEDCAILYWPPSKAEVRKFQSNPRSIPNYDNWLQYECEVKAEGILIYSHARAKVDQICMNTSTDEEQIIQANKRKQNVIRKPEAKKNYHSFFTPLTIQDNIKDTINLTLSTYEDIAVVIPEYANDTSELLKLTNLILECMKMFSTE